MSTTELLHPSTSGNDPQKVIKSLVEGILLFREALTGHPFYAYQQVFAQRIIEAVLQNDGDTITGLWSRQSGKTTAVAEIGITMAILMPVLSRFLSQHEGFEMLRPYNDGFRLGIFAPIRDQAGLSFGRMRDIAEGERASEILRDEEINTAITANRGDSLTFSHGSVVHAKTASPDSKIEGFTYHLIIIDEAQAVDRFKVEKEIEPMRASTNGVMTKIGTAWVSRGGFHSDIEYNTEVFRRGGPRNHFEFPYTIVVKEKRAAYEADHNPFHLAYEKYVESQQRKFGSDSLAFRMNFLLKWQDSRLDAISARALLGAEDHFRELNRVLPCPEGWLRVGGMDVAKVNDSTVVTVMDVDMTNPITIKDGDEDVVLYNKVVVALLELQGDFENSSAGIGQYFQVTQFLREWRVRIVYADATGMGDPVFERFKTTMPEVAWQPYKYTLQAKNDLFKHFLDEWEAGRIKIASKPPSKESPLWIQFFEQHKNLERTYVANNQYLSCAAPKPEGKTAKITALEYHDDYPNSCALACWAAKEGDPLGEILVTQGGIVASTRYHSRTAARYARRR